MVGEPARVVVGVAESCLNPRAERLHVADHVEVEVWDPEDRPVTFQASAPMRSEGTSSFENTVAISFTPDREGRWRVNAKFEPNIGQPQTVFEAVPLRADAGMRIVAVDKTVKCQQYAVTGRGTLLCASNQAIVTERGEHFEGSAFAIDQNVVWRLTAGSSPALERRVDDGTSLKLTHTRPIELGTAFLQAGRGEVYLYADDFAGGGLRRASPAADGGLTLEELEGVGQVRGMTVRADDALLIGWTDAGQPSVTALLADGGSQAFGQPFLQAAGGDDSVLWATNFSQELLAFQLKGTTLRRAVATLPIGVPPPMHMLMTPWSPVFPASVAFDGMGLPLFPRMLLPWFDGYDIRLESFEPGVGYAQVVSATKTHAFAPSGDGKTVKIFDR